MLRTTFLTLSAAVCAGSIPAPTRAPEPIPSMASAAQAFLATLEPARRAKASLPFNSDERLDWHYIPRSRQGLPLKQMSPEQRRAALALLGASLSQTGLTKADAIRRLEEVLFAIEGSVVRDPELYYFTVFGDPSEQGAWGWRYEGHHISLNWTVVQGKVAGSTPQFLGANPADVREGPMKGVRALAAEEDLGRALVGSLTRAQRAEGIVSETAPADILTAASRAAAIQKDEGIAYGRLNPEQQGLLLSLLQEYAAAQPPAVARERLDSVRKAGLERVRFAWMGGLEKGQGHYYRIQGPTFLVEYDNTQNNANHVHCVWRDFKSDWGEDVLAEHYRTSPHHADYRRAHRHPPSTR